MTHDALSLSEFASAEEKLLSAKLDAVRASIRHGGEKGRAIEQSVLAFLRSFLPGEYGLSAGFVAYHDGESIKLSKQLDIIIYDAVRSAPLASLGTCDVFAIEAVFAYVEVKASLCSTSNTEDAAADSIERCIADNHELRKMRERRYLQVSHHGSPYGVHRTRFDELSVRGYVFSLEARGSVACDIERLAQRVRQVSRAASRQAHLHGVFATNSGFLYTAPSTPETDKNHTHHVRFTKTHPLLTFKATMLEQLATFWRPPPDWFIDVRSYFDRLPEWGQTLGDDGPQF